MLVRKLVVNINLSIVILMLFALGAFSCNSDNEPEELISANEIVVNEQSASESPASDLEPDQVSEVIDSIIVGTQVGNRIPEFKVVYEDGTEVTSASLIENGRPVFMFFAATWCPGCTRELAELKEVYPEFTDDIVFISVGVDPTESMADLVQYKDQHGHPWTVAQPVGKMIADLRVTSQSTKIAFNSSGIITYRDGYGKDNKEIWINWMKNSGEGF